MSFVPPAAGLPVVLLAALCLAALLVSAASQLLMIRIGVLDRPGHRSSHANPTPKGGGVGPVLALLLLLPLGLWLSPIPPGGTARAAALLLAVAGLALVSWLDDLRQYTPLVKLSAQIACAGLIAAMVLPRLQWPQAGFAVAFCWLLFTTNAINFIDGLNGLAAGSMALCGLSFGLSAADPVCALTGVLLCAGLAGFLPYNYPRARIFLGDVGSQAAGLAIAACAVLHWRSDPTLAGALAGPLLLAGILYDVGFTLCRRAVRGERLSQAHRGHLYQIAFRSGIPAWLVALLHWMFVLWGAVLSLAASHGVGLPAIVVAALLPQLAWTGLVSARARLHPVGRW